MAEAMAMAGTRQGVAEAAAAWHLEEAQVETLLRLPADVRHGLADGDRETLADAVREAMALGVDAEAVTAAVTERLGELGFAEPEAAARRVMSWARGDGGPAVEVARWLGLPGRNAVWMADDPAALAAAVLARLMGMSRQAREQQMGRRLEAATRAVLSRRVR
jgi:hypothetical protein